MHNIIGPPARGDNFLPREKEVKRIIKAVNEGVNIQLAAPRRVGKTSILMFLLDNQPDENHYIYVDTEAISSSNEFFKKLYGRIIKSDYISGSRKVLQQLKSASNGFLQKIKGINLGGNGLELTDVQGLDYFVELNNLLKGVQLDSGKLVLMVDEFPYTISNILAGTEGISKANSFLQLNRELRLDPEVNTKIQFIYTGSIGLNTTVENLGSTALINDILSIKVDPITTEQAKYLTNSILNYEKKKISEEDLDYLLKRIEWLTPFYIKLMIKEIIDLMSEEDEEITISLINDGFQEIIDYRNNNYFEHYYSRLRGFFDGKSFKFIIEVLNFIVVKSVIEKAEAYNIATKHGVQENYRNLMHTLVYDGYIHIEDGSESFRFNSPILRIWWKKYVAN